MRTGKGIVLHGMKLKAQRAITNVINGSARTNKNASLMSQCSRQSRIASSTPRTQAKTARRGTTNTTVTNRLCLMISSHTTWN